MKELLEEIARGLVTQPEQVSVREIPSGEGVLLQLTVARDDRGRLIGRQGRTVRALRTFLRAVSLKTGRNLSLEISR